MPPRLKAAAKVALAVLAILGITIVVTNDTAPDGSRTHTIKVTVPAAAPHGELDSSAKLQGVRPAPSTVLSNIGNEMALVPPIPPAGAQTYSCRQRYGHRLFSSRNGVKPTEWLLHYTAGNGTPAGIDDYFGRTRAASATYIMSLDGKDCIQEVPESEEPWTQLAANSYAISIEIVTTGYNLTRDDWLKAGIFQHGTLAALMRDSMHRNGIPIRFVDPVGCNFIPGYADHNHLECGNNHTDVAPTFPFDVLARQLADSGAAPKPISAGQKARCTELNTLRRHTTTYRRKYHLTPVGHPLARKQRKRGAAIIAGQRKHGLVCKVGKPGKRGTITRKG